MKRLLMISAATALAAAPLLYTASPASADGLGLFQRGTLTQKQSRRHTRAARPQVRGFLFQPGGFSYDVPDSYSYDYVARPPSDFGPYLDYGPSAHGIIPNDAYR